MNEAEWFSGSDPQTMMEFLRTARAGGGTARYRSEVLLSNRKLRFFACGCCRQVWDRLTDPRSRQAVEVAERYADGEATEEEFTAAQNDVDQAFRDLGNPTRTWSVERKAWWIVRSCLLGPRQAVMEATKMELEGSPATQAALLRCLFGNPWRPVTVAHDGWKDPKSKIIADWRLEEKTVFWKSDWKRLLVWNGGTVPLLARAIYAERRWEDLPILADALIEAGCPEEERCRHCEASGYHRYADFADGTPNYSDSAPCGWCGGDGRVPHPLLPHLRGPGPHAKGCWVVDLILGKS
jgi:hypothetical protein